MIIFFLNISKTFGKLIIIARDKNKVCATALTDLSKTFDFVKYDILIVKLHTFGFDYRSLRVVNAHLSNRVQAAKVSFFEGKILDIIFGVSKDAILGSLFHFRAVQARSFELCR